jgi:amidase
MPSNDLLRLTALEQARLVRTRAISSEELTRLYLARIEQHDAALRSFVRVYGKAAIREAERKDREVARAGGRGLPPFHGVPIGIKDLNGVRGCRSQLGSRAYWYVVWPVDDPSVAQLRCAGFVFVGKLATSELGALPVTEPDIHPPTRNPWDLDVTPGGSSGGSAAAVAAGLIPIAHGSDGAGSIRIPSSLCHLFGLKPSRGRIPSLFERGPDTLTTCGPIARSVEDAAAMLDAQAGVTSGKPSVAPLPEVPFLDLARRPVPSLRIRFTTDSPLGNTDPEVDAAVRRVATRLEALGHVVEEGPGIAANLEEFLPIWQALIATAPVLRPSVLQPVTRWLWRAGKGLRAGDVLARRRLLSKRVTDWFGDADIWLTPSVPVAPPRIGAWREHSPEETFRQAAELGAFTALFNISGQPAASLPAGLSSGSHPIGVQLAGRPLADGLLLALARSLEEQEPWHAQWAPGWD